MVMQSEYIASWADGKRLAFIGDGDAISVCVAYLRARAIVDYGPEVIEVFDFDERIVNAVNAFAQREGISFLSARLYNCLDPFPACSEFDHFYTNPPWGASNDGESVNVFVERGIEAVGYRGHGAIVIADDEHLDWPRQVLANVQRFASDRGFYVSRMMPRLHSYHLDDAPDLRSCNLMISSVPVNDCLHVSKPVDQERFSNFYGAGRAPTVKYIREVAPPEYGKANEHEYYLEVLEGVER